MKNRNKSFILQFIFKFKIHIKIFNVVDFILSFKKRYPPKKSDIINRKIILPEQADLETNEKDNTDPLSIKVRSVIIVELLKNAIRSGPKRPYKNM